MSGCGGPATSQKVLSAEEPELFNKFGFLKLLLMRFSRFSWFLLRRTNITSLLKVRLWPAHGHAASTQTANVAGVGGSVVSYGRVL